MDDQLLSTLCNICACLSPNTFEYNFQELLFFMCMCVSTYHSTVMSLLQRVLLDDDVRVGQDQMVVVRPELLVHRHDQHGWVTDTTAVDDGHR